MPFRWSGLATQTVSATAISAVPPASPMKQFREPGFFEKVVPGYVFRDDLDTPSEPKASHSWRVTVLSRQERTAVSGLPDAGAAVGLLIPATCRATATGVTALFAVFLAGHVGALRRACGPAGSPARRRAQPRRLPVPLPLILWAWGLRTPGIRHQP